ncbi:hypothetical protein P692DRAFT_20875776 [Suillus brevipes Sb2]|nr:hypothetical protein P692DRAFT_20875776 [Suillus brevipes Sb2]
MAGIKRPLALSGRPPSRRHSPPASLGRQKSSQSSWNTCKSPPKAPPKLSKVLAKLLESFQKLRQSTHKAPPELSKCPKASPQPPKHLRPPQEAFKSAYQEPAEHPSIWTHTTPQKRPHAMALQEGNTAGSTSKVSS